MSEKKIVVPEGMLKAALNTWNRHHLVDPELRSAWTMERLLEAALEWWSENPFAPTDEQANEFLGCGRDKIWACDIIDIWQRRMFRAPEQEIPEEVEDLFLGTEHDRSGSTIRRAVVEAYRIGIRDGKREV